MFQRFIIKSKHGYVADGNPFAYITRNPKDAAVFVTEQAALRLQQKLEVYGLNGEHPLSSQLIATTKEELPNLPYVSLSHD